MEAKLYKECIFKDGGYMLDMVLTENGYPRLEKLVTKPTLEIEEVVKFYQEKGYNVELMPTFPCPGTTDTNEMHLITEKMDAFKEVLAKIESQIGRAHV